MARPAKSLEQHVREGTFRARRHADLLAEPELAQWPAFAALQRQYRQAADSGDKNAIALEFERAVGRVHRDVKLASTPSPEPRSKPASEGLQSTDRPLGRAPNSPVPRLALSPTEAAQALGVSRDFFDQHIAPELRILRRGRRKLIPIRELDQWLSEQSAFALERTP